MGFSMRGQRPPPDPFVLTAEQLAREAYLRAKAAPEKRFMQEGIAEIIGFALRRACENRGGRCTDVLVARSVIYAVVCVPELSESGLCDAVRLIAAKRARRVLHWPKSERVFTLRNYWWPLGIEGPCMDVRRRFPALLNL